MVRLLVLLLVSTAVFAQENPLDKVKFYDIKDVDFTVFDNPKYSKYYNKAFDKKEFFKNYFKVWNEKQRISETEMLEFFDYDDAVKNFPCIAENYNELSDKIISEIKCNIPKPTNELTVEYGLTIKTANLRRFPTNEFCYKRVRNAGEGYPFDYFQYSSLWIATPVAILTKTKDGLWYFVNSQNNKGWVKSDELVIITKKQSEDFQKMNFATPLNDKAIIKGKKTYKIFLGTLLPLISNKLLLPNKTFNNRLVYDKVQLTSSFSRFPIKFTKDNVKHLLSELHHFKYTWGGLNEGRDCSSTLKDFYTPFALWLPRNSIQQSKVGQEIELKGTPVEKEYFVTQKAIPFLSTLYKKGHIVLYVGKSKGKSIIFQNVWGIKAYHNDKQLYYLADKRQEYGLFGFNQINETNKIETRFNIGKAVFTEIEPSKSIDNTTKNVTTESFLENFKTLTLLNN